MFKLEGGVFSRDLGPADLAGVLRGPRLGWLLNPSQKLNLLASFFVVNIETQKAKVLRAKQKNAKFRNDSYLSGIMGNQRLTFSEYKALSLHVPI